MFVGVVEPNWLHISRAADDTTFTFDVTLHGFDAAIDVAADVERGVVTGLHSRVAAHDYKPSRNYRCCYRCRR